MLKLISVLILAACSGELPVDMSKFIPETATLAAEGYQSEIMEIDHLVFSENEIGEPGRSALASKLVTLADRVDADRGESKFLRLEAGELNELAARIRRIPVGAAVPSSLRDQWMRIRSNVFDDRWWFARSFDILMPCLRRFTPRWWRLGMVQVYRNFLRASEPGIKSLNRPWADCDMLRLFRGCGNISFSPLRKGASMYRMLLVSTLALGLTGSALAECTAAEKRALEQLDRTWAEASRTGDRAALQQILASDYMNLTPGATQNKTETIEGVVADAERARQNPNPPRSSYDHYIINCTPNTATLTHRSVTTTMVDGKEHTNYARSVHVLEKRGGNWQVVSNAGHPLSDAATIMYKELEWTEADLRNDVSWFEQNLASDYVGISSKDGKMMRRSEEIADFRNRKDRIETAETTDLNVRMEGDVGIATGVYHVTGRDEAGKRFDRRIRFVDTYVKRDGKWQPLVSQGTRIE